MDNVYIGKNAYSIELKRNALTKDWTRQLQILCTDKVYLKSNFAQFFTQLSCDTN